MKIFFLFLVLSACTAPPTSSRKELEILSSGGGNEFATDLEEDQQACAEGEKRSCHVLLGNHEDVKSCFVGVQFCVSGKWTTCGSQ